MHASINKLILINHHVVLSLELHWGRCVRCYGFYRLQRMFPHREESYVPWLKGSPRPLWEGFPRSVPGSEWLLTSSAHTPEKKKSRR